MPPSVQASFQGTAAGVSSIADERAVADSGGDRHRLHRARRAVRELHPSDHDSVDAAVGGRRARFSRCWSAAPISASSRLIGIILLIGIVKKNAIMMIDFALEAERHEDKKPLEAIYQACLLRFRPIMMTTMAALLRRRAAGARHRRRR